MQAFLLFQLEDFNVEVSSDVNDFWQLEQNVTDLSD